MDMNEDWDQGYADNYDKYEEAKQIHQKKLAKKYFDLPGINGEIEIHDKRKLPIVRSSYLRKAFFKCYFSRVTHSEVDRKPEETLRTFAKLFFYHQEVRIDTRKAFDRFNEKFIKRDEVTVLKEHLKQKVNDGCKVLNTLPIPDYDIAEMQKKSKNENFDDPEQKDAAISNILAATDRVDITFNPKRRDFPRPDELFLRLTNKDAQDIEKENGNRYISFLPRKHSIKTYISITTKNADLWDKAFALLVLDSIEELEKEIEDTGIHDAYTPQPSIKTAIDHFDQNYSLAKEMDKHEKAYSISLRYKNKKTDTPFVRESILKALNRKET